METIGKNKRICSISKRNVKRDGKIEHQGEYYTFHILNLIQQDWKPLKIIEKPLRSDIPIYIAAIGPKISS